MLIRPSALPSCHLLWNASPMIYSDTDSDYEIALIVAITDSLKDRREMLMVRFFKRQVLASNALLHYLNDVTMTLSAA